MAASYKKGTYLRGGGLLILLGCVGGWSNSAAAQNLGGPPYYVGSIDRAFVDPGVTLGGDPNLSGPFARRGNVSVLDRPHPEYAPLGIRAGIFEILPSSDTRMRYESNIYAQPKKISDEILDERVHIEADSLWVDNALNFYGDVRRRQYLQHGTESSTTYDVGASGRLLADRGTPITGTISYASDVEPRTAVSGNITSRRPIRFQRLDAQGQITREFDRLVVRVTGRYSDYNYHNGTNALGGIVQQDYRDHDEIHAGAEVDYALTPSFAPFVAATYNSFDYDIAKQIVPLNRNSNGYEVAVGVDFDIGHLMRGRVQVGSLHQEFRSAAIADVSAPSFHGRLEYFPTQLLTITALVSRNLYDSQLAQAPTYLDTSSALRADYEWMRNFILSAEAGYELADFRGIDRTDKRRTVSLSGTYLASRALTLRAQYINLHQDSDGSNRSPRYTDDAIYLGIVLAL